MKTPLAWLQLTHEKIRLLIALLGIGFADMLMFMQLGFRDALFESSVTIHKNLEGQIFLMSPQSTALIAMKSFSSRRLYQSLGVEGVRSVNPVYMGFGIWKNPVELNTRSIFVIGFNPRDNIFQLPEVREKLDLIKLEDFILFDRASRPEFGPIAELFAREDKLSAEVDGYRLRIGGLFTLGASFGADGNIITSDTNFLRLFPQREPGLIDIGIINLEPNTNELAVLEQLRQNLPNDVLVLSREEFIDFERKYWQTSTAIGFVFSLGTIMGWIVGTVIVYQVLYTDVADHLPEYATMKAMGYQDRYFLLLVFQEAVILGFAGYIPGFFIAKLLYFATAGATSLPIAMTVARASTVLILTIVMCCFSGVIAMRKLSSADPADIY